MKVLFNILIVIITVNTSAQNKVRILSHTNYLLNVSIDSQIQAGNYSKDIYLVDIPNTINKMTIHIVSDKFGIKNNIDVTIGDKSKNEVYSVYFKDSFFVVNNNRMPDKLGTIAVYKPRKSKPIIDSTDKKSSNTPTCAVSDSIVDVSAKTISKLNENMDKIDRFMESKFKNKCLKTYQIHSLTKYFKHERSKLDFIKKYYSLSIDKSQYREFISLFKSQAIANDFDNWYKKIKK